MGLLQIVQLLATNYDLGLLEPAQGCTQVLDVAQETENLVNDGVLRHAFFAKECHHGLEKYVSLLTHKFIWDIAGDENPEIHNPDADNLIDSFMGLLILNKVDVL